jgi:hypothetical protein
VEIEAVVAGNTDDVIATAGAQVGADATAVVDLFIPADVTGALVIRVQPGAVVLGTVSVTTP